MQQETPMCDGCGKKIATCQAKAGRSVFFVSKSTGDAYYDPDRMLYHCDDCCGHSGEDGRCEPLPDTEGD